MSRAWLCCAFFAACTPMERTVRTERGPLLRSFTRQQVLEGGLRGEVRVDWPRLVVRVIDHDLCREISVDEYAEEVVTEKSSRAAGPALSTGSALTLGAAALFGISYALSSNPDTTVIDTAGRFGPPPRTVMQGWSVVSLALGVPALIVGLVGYLRTGEEIEQRKAEQETGQRDVECNTRPVVASLRVLSRHGEVGTVALVEGEGVLDAAVLKGPPEELAVGERAIELDEPATLTLVAFAACMELEAEGARAPESLGDGALVARVDKLKACRQVRGEALAKPLEAAEAELAKRRETGAPGAFSPGPTVSSFEAAVSAYAPRLTLKEGSADLSRLDAPELLSGQAVLIQGVVSSGIAENIGVLQLGSREVFVFIPPKRSWGGDFSNGARVEAVAVMAGWQTVGEKTLPLARLVFMRTAF